MTVSSFMHFRRVGAIHRLRGLAPWWVALRFSDLAMGRVQRRVTGLHAA